MTPEWSFLASSFFFTLGLVFRLELQQFKQWLAHWRRALLAAVIVLGALAVFEAELVFRTTGRDLHGTVHTIAASSYAVASILCFLAFDSVPVPFAKTANQLVGKTFGIYLLHGKVMEFVARVVRQLVPWMLANQLLSFQPLLFAFGLGVPLLFMAFVSRSPARRYYRYLFG
jgi:surface polysaccharide O-acyltransferase-like enzyme